MKLRGKELNDHLDSVAHVVQHAVVDGLADVAHRPLGIGWGDDLVCAGCVLVGGEDANLPPGYLLFVDVHRLRIRGRGQDMFISFYSLLSGRDVSDGLVIKVLWSINSVER